MTHDFADALVEAHAAEKEPYLLVYRTGEGGVRVRYCLDNWESNPVDNCSAEEDVIRLLERVLEPKERE